MLDHTSRQIMSGAGNSFSHKNQPPYSMFDRSVCWPACFLFILSTASTRSKIVHIALLHAINDDDDDVFYVRQRYSYTVTRQIIHQSFWCPSHMSGKCAYIQSELVFSLCPSNALTSSWCCSCGYCCCAHYFLFVCANDIFVCTIKSANYIKTVHISQHISTFATQRHFSLCWPKQ